MDKLKPKTFYEYVVGDKTNWILFGFLVLFGYTPGVLLLVYTSGYRWFWFLLSVFVTIVWYIGEKIYYNKYINVLEK